MTPNFISTPLENINYSFAKYVENKKSFERRHLDGNGLPDYAYKMDYEYRKKLDSMPGVYKFAKKFASTIVPQMIHQHSAIGIQVGPNQYPEIYQMTKECAERLGIGIPKLIIVPEISLGGTSSTDFNAITYAVDDVEPLIVITGLMIERFTADEIKAIIGHECGHIHNNHGVYSVLENIISILGISSLLSIPLLAPLANAITTGAQIALNMWSRAAEITSDRAALICVGDPKVAAHVDVKFLYKGTDLSGSTKSEVNFEALREQMNEIINNPHRLTELLYDHPLSIKRAFATLDFWECEKMYEWRPDLRDPGRKLYTKEQTDEKCKKYLDVIKPKGVTK